MTIFGRKNSLCAKTHQVKQQYLQQLSEIVFLAMSPRTNDLLASLPSSEFEEVSKYLELTTLQKGHTLFHIGQTPKFFYYPVGAVVSMLSDQENGSTTETHMLGKTCLVGVGAVNKPSFYRAQVRSTGLAYRIAAADLKKVKTYCPTLIQNASIAVERLLNELSQAIVCSKRHACEQQIIRWTLTTLDRSIDSKIAITHQELADILGFQREAITLSLGKMQAKNEIKIGRGSFDVINRKALELRSCECYWIGQQRQRPLSN